MITQPEYGGRRVAARAGSHVKENIIGDNAIDAIIKGCSARCQIAAHAHADQHDLSGSRVIGKECIKHRADRLFPFMNEGQPLIAQHRPLPGTVVSQDGVPVLVRILDENEIEFLNGQIEAAAKND